VTNRLSFFGVARNKPRSHEVTPSIQNGTIGDCFNRPRVRPASAVAQKRFRASKSTRIEDYNRLFRALISQI